MVSRGERRAQGTGRSESQRRSKSRLPSAHHCSSPGGFHGVLGFPGKAVRWPGKADYGSNVVIPTARGAVWFCLSARNASQRISSADSARPSTRRPPTERISTDRAGSAPEGGRGGSPGGVDVVWPSRHDSAGQRSATKLIDRGLLTQGLLTAEELAEIHRIGDEWSKHANRLDHIQVQAGQSAEAAVEADRPAGPLSRPKRRPTQPNARGSTGRLSPAARRSTSSSLAKASRPYWASGPATPTS